MPKHPLIEALPPDVTPLFFDASAFKTTKCDQLFAFAVAKGYRLRKNNPAFQRGKALHKYAELRELGVDPIVALAEAVATPGLDDKHVILSACSQYDKMGLPAALRQNGRAMVEHQFLVNYGSRVCGGRKFAIFLTGRIDRINFNSRGVVEIIDYKSSTLWRVEDILSRYDHDVQLDLYPWILKKYAYEIFTDLNVANAAWAGKLGTRVVPIMIGNKTMPKWEVGPLKIMSEDEHLDFGKLLDAAVERLVSLTCALLDEEFEPNRTGRLNNSCPGCDMLKLCYAADAHERQSYMAAIDIKQWDPTSW